jgi:anthranilate/para-aminobenzoate synthase component I
MWKSRSIRPLSGGGASTGNASGLAKSVAGEPGGVMLESHGPVSEGPEPGLARYSIYATTPLREVIISQGNGQDPLHVLSEATRSVARFERRCELPFIAGWIGFLSYEAGRFAEPRVAERFGMETPLAVWRLYDSCIVHDRAREEWSVVAADLSAIDAGSRTDLESRLDELERFGADSFAQDHPSRPVEGLIGHWNIEERGYLSIVERALEYIRAGDIFQVNLARRFRVESSAEPIAIYEALCRANPAGFAAYVPMGGPGDRRAVLSSSPELFLSLRDGEVMTRPIKGTRPRGATMDEDARLALELSSSEKERAELNMIIDLERNDLGRVCEYGTVRVIDEGSIETHPTVLHRTATIVGKLREECHAGDLLRAAFPCGSITGAPKVRAMEIIRELEPDARGPYCGAIGWIGVDGSMCLNVAIRTLTVQSGHVDLHVGSGIVVDSDPGQELAELDAKAAGMLAALGQSTKGGIVRV